ncbi:MAG TPA: potassium channel protein [Polyangiaceae bacterium]|nr:potassium channel protein [Polyangiaceae bacterium]
MHASIRRLLIALGFFLCLVFGGAAGYFVLGHGRWGFGECLYMTIITLSTVGFGELNQMADVEGARGLTVVLIVSGIGALAYVQGNLTALLVEGAIGQALRRNRMRKRIDSLHGHIVVAGAGATGKHVLEELLHTQTPFVVIDRDLAHLERLSEDLTGGKMLYIPGDATDDHVLISAGVKRARGVVAALTHDKDNVFVTLSARSLNAQARIVAKVVENEAAPKLIKAGATSVVNPTMIGGFRLASELIRPEVNEFLDQMLRDKEKNLRLEEVIIPAQSTFSGVPLKDTPIRQKTKLLVVAIRDKDRTFVYNPEPNFVIEPGATLIVMGETESVLKLRRLVLGDEEPEVPESQR